jgi:ABC-2 type transport system permease protein
MGAAASNPPVPTSLLASLPQLWWRVAVLGFRRPFAYFGATWAGVFTNTVFGFLRAYVLVAMFRSLDRVGGFDLTDSLTYVFLTQGLIMVVQLWGANEISLRIRTGEIASDLFRPADFQLYWLSQDLGRAAYFAIFRGIPPFLVGALFFHLRLPAEPSTWAVFLLSCVLAATVSFGLRFLMGLASFWLLDDRGASRLYFAVVTFFSGFAIPVAFFPSALRSVANALPFPSLVETPIEVFLAKAGLAAIAVQVMWCGLLLIAGRVLLAAAIRKVVVQGG